MQVERTKSRGQRLVDLIRVGGAVAMGLGASASAAQQLAVIDRVPIARPKGYILVFNEDFNQAHAFDPSKWSLDQDHNAPWSDLSNYFVGAPGSNCYVMDGRLVLKAMVASDANASDTQGQHKRYISASVTTRNRHSWTYGYFEIRARFPVARGLLPAIWMMPASKPVHWPDDGEIDIAEQVGFDPDVLHGTLHMQGATPGSGAKIAPGEFHTYQLLWTPNSVRLGVDGRVYMTYRRPQATDHLQWPFDRPFYLLLTLSVGGSWAGQQGIDERALPASMEVDYVRVYQLPILLR